MDDNDIVLHGVEYGEGEPRYENAAETPKLYRVGFSVPRDQRYCRIHAADEV